MKKRKNLGGGYIGLLMLLLGVVIVVFLIVRMDLFSGQNRNKNMIEQGMDSIDQAKAVKNLIESNNKKTFAE